MELMGVLVNYLKIREERSSCTSKLLVVASWIALQKKRSKEEKRENSLFDTTQKYGSLFDTQKFFLPYMTLCLKLLPYMTLPSSLPLVFSYVDQTTLL
jgi:hypothetical protein